MTSYSHKMLCRSAYTYTAPFHFLQSVHIWRFPSSLQSSILKMEAICSQDVVNELLHHLAQQTCMYQCHVTPAARKVLILTVSPVESVRLWRVLKFYYEVICVFIKEYMEQPFRTNIPLILQKANSLLLKWQGPPYSSQMFNKIASPQPPLLLFILRILLLPFTLVSITVIITSSNWNMNNGSFPRLVIKILQEKWRLINQTLMHWIPTV